MGPIFQTSSQIEKIQTLVDGGCKLSVVTQELSPEEMTMLFSLKQKQGWFIFKETEISSEDINIPEITPEFKGEKTPSQRLRNVIYIFWQQNGSKGDFETFYKHQIERIITSIKEKLN